MSQTICYLFCLYPWRLLWPGRGPLHHCGRRVLRSGARKGTELLSWTCSSSWWKWLKMSCWCWSLDMGSFCWEALAHDKLKAPGAFVLVPGLPGFCWDPKPPWDKPGLISSQNRFWVIIWRVIWWRHKNYTTSYTVEDWLEFVDYISRWFNLTGFQSPVFFHWESSSPSKYSCWHGQDLTESCKNHALTHPDMIDLHILGGIISIFRIKIYTWGWLIQCHLFRPKRSYGWSCIPIYLINTR